LPVNVGIVDITGCILRQVAVTRQLASAETK
jgi:hypothetical protein